MRRLRQIFSIELSAICLALWLLSCDTTSEVEYDYRASAHIDADSATSTSDHHLNLSLLVQTPSRACWALDFAGFENDSDTVARTRFIYVKASIKKPTTATNCLNGLDTVRARVSIPFGASGLYNVDFPQVNKDGFLIRKRNVYRVQ